VVQASAGTGSYAAHILYSKLIRVNASYSPSHGAQTQLLTSPSPTSHDGMDHLLLSPQCRVCA
jgi:hypothetical protein